MKFRRSGIGKNGETERYFNVMGLIYNRSVRVAYHTFFRSWFYTCYEIQDHYHLVKRAKLGRKDKVNIDKSETTLIQDSWKVVDSVAEHSETSPVDLKLTKGPRKKDTAAQTSNAFVPKNVR